MGTVGELISTNVTDELINSQTWSGAVVNVEAYGAKEGGTEDSIAAISSAIIAAKEIGAKVLFPGKSYLISSPIITDGVNLVGTSSSGFSASSKGTRIICATKDFSAFKQVSTDTKDITYSVEGFCVEDAAVGLETTYAVNCVFRNMFFDSCTLGIKHGISTVLGGLFNTYENCYTNNCEKALEINGSQWNNNNIFINCYFGGNARAVKIDCNGGIGAVNNHFICCEIKTSTSYGVELVNAKNTTFINPYFECAGPAVFSNGGVNTVIKQGVYSGLVNTNTEGLNAFIYLNYNSSLSAVSIDGGYIYLAKATSNDNCALIGAANSSYYSKANIINFPIGEFPLGYPTNWKWTLSYAQYADRNFTGVNILGGSVSPTLHLRCQDENDGLVIMRNRAAGGTDYGSVMMHKGANVLYIPPANDGLVWYQKMSTASDIEITDDTKGIILGDRSNTNKYRLLVNGGVLSIELVT